MKWIVYSITVMLCLANEQASAQSIENVSGNPAAQTFKIETSDGALIVLDNVTQKVYVAGAEGQVAEVSFADAVSHVEPDISKQASLYEELRATMIDPACTATFTNSPVPRLAYSEGPGPGPGDFQVESTDPGASVSDSMGGSGGMEDWLGGPCDLGPCSPYIGDLGRIFYVQDGHSGRIGSESVDKQKEWADDYQRWQYHRNGRCKDFREQSVETAAIGTAAAGTCWATAPTGGGVLACAGASALYLIALRRSMAAHRDCAASYPGPGNW